MGFKRYGKWVPTCKPTFICSAPSDFVNIDVTRNSVDEASIENGKFSTTAASQEQYRPNYMTRERCGDRGCAPCSKNLPEPDADGCLVPMKTGKQDRWHQPQEWFGLTTSKGSDLIKSSADLELKCNHTGQEVPIRFYAETHNKQWASEEPRTASITLSVNGKAQVLTSMHTHMQPRICTGTQAYKRTGLYARVCVQTCAHTHMRTCCTRTNASVYFAHAEAGSCPDYAVRLTKYPEGILEVFLSNHSGRPQGWYPVCGRQYSEKRTEYTPANTACKMLGYQGGSAATTNSAGDVTTSHSRDAFDLGYCRDGEWGLDNACSGGLNLNAFTAACNAQGKGAFMVKCWGGNGGKQHACSADTKHGVCLAVYTGIFQHACKFTGRMPWCRHRLPWTCMPVKQDDDRKGRIQPHHCCRRASDRW